MRDLIEAGKLEDPLCIIDLGRVVRLFEMWRRELPRVTPFYAVKCLTDNALMATLAALGAGFDCASEQEVCAKLKHDTTNHNSLQMCRRHNRNVYHRKALQMACQTSPKALVLHTAEPH